MGLFILERNLLESGQMAYLVLSEKRFAKRKIKHMLQAYQEVTGRGIDLSGKPLYREVLLHMQQIDPARVDQILRQAEDSVDEWTAPGRDEMGFRELVHYLLHTQYTDRGRTGSVVSFGRLVNTLVPGHL